MMKIKKREITITILIALICVAGYVNWNYQRQQALTVSTREASELTANEQNIPAASPVQEDDAQSTEGGYFSEQKINKEKAKSESIELLNKILSNENASDEAKQKVQEDILFLSKSIEMEERAQTLLRAKGFQDTNVLISTDVVNVIVKTQGLNKTDVAKIRDIAAEVSGMPYDAIKIIEVKN
jgi:stage III sporulation protein AH